MQINALPTSFRVARYSIIRISIDSFWIHSPILTTEVISQWDNYDEYKEAQMYHQVITVWPQNIAQQVGCIYHMKNIVKGVTQFRTH